MGDDLGGEVGPSLTRVEDDAVRADDDLVDLAQLRVGADRQANFPWPAIVSGELAEEGLETAAVRDGTIQEPENWGPRCVAGILPAIRGRDALDMMTVASLLHRRLDEAVRTGA